MDYTIQLSFAMYGDVVPLTKVSEAMATRKTNGGGAIPWHEDTYLSVRQQYEDLLLDAVTKNALVTCDQFGKVGSADEIVDAELMARNNPDYPKIYCLYVKEYHLTQWAATNGDIFTLKDTGVEVFNIASGVATLESVPTQTAATPESSVADRDGSASKRRKRKPSWSVVAMPYMRQLYKDIKSQSATIFYKALKNRAGQPDSPFTIVSGHLFCDAAGTTVAEGTVGKHWAEIRNR